MADLPRGSQVDVVEVGGVATQDLCADLRRHLGIAVAGAKLVQEIWKTRSAWMTGCVGPYQVASVPHRMLSSPT